MATLERAFAGTLAYLEALERAREQSEVWPARCLREYLETALLAS